MSQDYTVFVHVLDASGKLSTQSDLQPRHGAYPTTLWDVGEIIPDEYSLTLPNELAPGNYSIVVGWYSYPKLARIGLSGSDGIWQADYWIVPEQIKVSQ